MEATLRCLRVGHAIPEVGMIQFPLAVLDARPPPHALLVSTNDESDGVNDRYSNGPRSLRPVVRKGVMKCVWKIEGGRKGTRYKVCQKALLSLLESGQPHNIFTTGMNSDLISTWIKLIDIQFT